MKSFDDHQGGGEPEGNVFGASRESGREPDPNLGVENAVEPERQSDVDQQQEEN